MTDISLNSLKHWLENLSVFRSKTLFPYCNTGLIIPKRFLQVSAQPPPHDSREGGWCH